MLLSQFFHIFIYKCNHLRTWFNWLKLTTFSPSKLEASIGSITIGIMVFFMSLFFYNNRNKIDEITLIKYGFIYILSSVALSQLIFSSIMRLVYETMFLGLFVFNIAINKLYLHYANIFFDKKELYDELWNVFRISISLSIGMPIIAGGGALLASFFKNDISFLRIQLYRHLTMILYFEFGIILLVIWPVIKQILLMRKFILNLDSSNTYEPKKVK